jgi:hypothetical protein
MAENNFPLMSGGNLYPILRKYVKLFIVYVIIVHLCKVGCSVG